MSYVSLYRKFRPATFGGVIGQDAIVRTLVNQIRLGMVGHAYLFTGSRGTGKTSTAKIFARAVNCLSPVNGSPCNQCAVCKELLSPASLDILELDAASNNGIDEMRDIKERVNFPPTVAQYKIFIIDEVHSLSTAAFNALLKTLEEPPPYVIFILATTEVHKLPQTILSRCIRFDFQLVSDDKLTAHLKNIFDAIGYKYDPEAVREIAKNGNGSVRDALSIADSCIAYSPEKLTYEDVLDVLGASSFSALLNIANGVLNGDAGAILTETEIIQNRGKGIQTVYKEVLDFFRTIIAVKNIPSYRGNLRESEYEIIKAIGEIHDNHRLAKILQTVSGLESDLRYSTAPAILLESALVRASQTVTDIAPEGVLSRLRELETKLASGVITYTQPKIALKEEAENAPSSAQAAVSAPQAAVSAPETMSNASSTIDSAALGLSEDSDAPVFEVKEQSSEDNAALEILHVLPSRLLDMGYGIFSQCVGAVRRATLGNGEYIIYLNDDLQAHFFSSGEYIAVLEGIIREFKPDCKLVIDLSYKDVVAKKQEDEARLVDLFGNKIIKK